MSLKVFFYHIHLLCVGGWQLPLHNPFCYQATSFPTTEEEPWDRGCVINICVLQNRKFRYDYYKREVKLALKWKQMNTTLQGVELLLNKITKQIFFCD